MTGNDDADLLREERSTKSVPKRRRKQKPPKAEGSNVVERTIESAAANGTVTVAGGMAQPSSAAVVDRQTTADYDPNNRQAYYPRYADNVAANNADAQLQPKDTGAAQRVQPAADATETKPELSSATKRTRLADDVKRNANDYRTHVYDEANGGATNFANGQGNYAPDYAPNAHYAPTDVEKPRSVKVGEELDFEEERTPYIEVNKTGTGGETMPIVGKRNDNRATTFIMAEDPDTVPDDEVSASAVRANNTAVDYYGNVDRENRRVAESQKAKNFLSQNPKSVDDIVRNGTAMVNPTTVAAERQRQNTEAERLEAEKLENESPLQRRKREWDEYVESLEDPEERERMKIMSDSNATLYDRLERLKRYNETPQQEESREKREKRQRNLAGLAQMIGSLGSLATAVSSRYGRAVKIGDLSEAVATGQEKERTKREKAFEEIQKTREKIDKNQIDSLAWLDKFRKDKHSAALADLREQRMQLRTEYQNAKTDEERKAIQTKLDQTDKRIEIEQKRLGIAQQNANTATYRAANSASAQQARSEAKKTDISFGKGNRHVVSIDDNLWAKNPGNILYVYNAIPESIRKSIGDEIHGDRYQPTKVTGRKKATVPQMREAIRRYINQYPDVGKAVLEIAGLDPDDAQYDEYFGRSGSSGSVSEGNGGGKVRTSHKRSDRNESKSENENDLDV